MARPCLGTGLLGVGRIARVSGEFEVAAVGTVCERPGAAERYAGQVAIDVFVVGAKERRNLGRPGSGAVTQVRTGEDVHAKVTGRALVYLLLEADLLAKEVGGGVQVLSEEKFYCHICKSGLTLSTKASMVASDLLGMVKMIHLKL